MWSYCSPWRNAVFKSTWLMSQPLIAANWHASLKPGRVAVGESVCCSSFCLSRKPRSTHLALHFWNEPSGFRLIVSTHLPVTKFLALTFLRSTSSNTSFSTQDLYSACFASRTVWSTVSAPFLWLPFLPLPCVLAWPFLPLMRFLSFLLLQIPHTRPLLMFRRSNDPT